jgi:hypothetical protein
MAYGNVAADFDAIELSVREGEAWTPVAIGDAGFEDAAGLAASAGWRRAGSSKTAEISRPAEQAPQGRHFARLGAAPPIAIQAELFEEGAPSPGDSIDVDLGAGLKARVALALSDSAAAGPPLEASLNNPISMSAWLMSWSRGTSSATSILTGAKPASIGTRGCGLNSRAPIP